MRNLTSRISIKTEPDITRAVVEGGRLARAMGFPDPDVQRLSTAVSELARNIVKYAGSGQVQIMAVTEDAREGLRVTARDTGPGITDVEEAMQDHFSSSGTLGLGLPGVKRMVDEFDIVSIPGTGTTVTVNLWRGQASRRSFRLNPDVVRAANARQAQRTRGRGFGGVLVQEDEVSPVEGAYFIRPCLGERVSGDDVLMKRVGDHVLVLVVDGLGHGPTAHEAASRAKQCLRQAWSNDPVENLNTINRELDATVGAAVGIGVLGLDRMVVRYVGVGNTVMRVMGRAPGRISPVEGTVGDRMRPPKEQRVQLRPRDTVLFYTDGLSDRFELNQFPQMVYEALPSVARTLVERFGKTHDDATCAVLRVRA